MTAFQTSKGEDSLCGITGWVRWSGGLSKELHTLERMGDTLSSRGPDEYGIWHSDRCAFAHRRLIVIDPEGGYQPMVRFHGDARFVINYNGELYNAEELRRELRSHGWTFTGRSDTEVLLTAYMQWKADCLPRLNGIFAFAVWDERRQELFLARDRLGVKPLFYTTFQDSFLFGSELKALLCHPQVSPELGEDGLAEVFALGPARTPGHGVFRNLWEVKPGNFLVVRSSGIQERVYWRLETQAHPDDLETTVEKVRTIFSDAVKRQLIADVRVCSLLSGGIDSTALTGVALHHLRERGFDTIDTFSIDYVGNEEYFQSNDFQPDRDAPWVRYVSQALQTRHHPVELDSEGIADELEVGVRARDLPGMADIDVSLLLFCRAIKKVATVALSGECADEIFGGYPWFRRPEAIRATTFPWSLKLPERLHMLSPELIRRIRPVEYVEQRYQEALAEVPRGDEDDPSEARIRELRYLSLTRWMPTLLDRKDRMSMATGLEVRVPYCDHRLIEYVWNVPWTYLRADGELKGLLRKAVEPWVPSRVLNRRKSPYPKTYDPAYLHRVRVRLLAALDHPQSALRDLVDVEAVRRFAWSGVEELDVPWFGQLMTGPQWLAYLVQIDAWLRHYRVKIV